MVATGRRTDFIPHGAHMDEHGFMKTLTFSLFLLRVAGWEDFEMAYEFQNQILEL